MIKSKNAYLEQDRLGLKEKKGAFIVQLVRDLFFHNYIYVYQRKLRKLEYNKNAHNSVFRRLYYLYLYSRYRRYQIKLGFSIPTNGFQPRLGVAHYGPVVVNGN